jgi:hypothetical protein
LEFAGRNGVRGRRDDVANVQAFFKIRTETVRTFGPTGAQTADATAKTGAEARDATAETETGTENDAAFAFVANVGRLNLRRRLSRGRVDRDERVLSVDGGSESERGGDQKTREKVVFHLFLLKNTGRRFALKRLRFGKRVVRGDATTGKAVETSSRSDAIRAFLKNA